jgi:hypothetical protein
MGGENGIDAEALTNGFIKSTTQGFSIITNMWVYGSHILSLRKEYCEGVLMISNVWSDARGDEYDMAFWGSLGMTNGPVRLNVPGDCGYFLYIGGEHVLPFLGRIGGGRAEPDSGIWHLPALPVRIASPNSFHVEFIQISECRDVAVEGNTVVLSGGDPFLRKSWRIKENGGLLQIQVVIRRVPLD